MFCDQFVDYSSVNLYWQDSDDPDGASDADGKDSDDSDDSDDDSDDSDDSDDEVDGNDSQVLNIQFVLKFLCSFSIYQ